ncbi:GumC family protein [Geminicoccus flavidas]|uniref:GumC family protein n=1 Tax=Geminicoccus flavidas TaxID=2506407 RepID=UPI00135A6349|nr:AAA family ATPase [Geminicoccus flavidas]
MTQDRAQPGRAVGAEPGIADQVRVLRRHWPALVGMTALGVAAAGLTARLIEPVYVARAEVIYEPVTFGGPDGLDQIAAPPESGTLDSQIRQIASRAMAREVIQRLDLGPELEGRPGLVARPVAWLTGLMPAEGPAPEGLVEVPIDAPPGEPSPRLLDRFLDRLKGSREGKSHVVAITWEANDPQRAAEVANEVAHAFVTARIAQKLEAASRVEERLALRRSQLRDALLSTEARLEQARAAARPTLVAALGSGEDQLNALSRELVEARIEAQTREVRSERLKDAAKRGQGLLGAEESQPSPYQALLALDAAAAREEAELLAQYGERHPRVVDLRSRRKELARKLASAQGQMLQKLDMEAEMARVRADGLARQLEAIKGDAAGMATSRQELAALEEEARTRRQAHDAFELKAQEISQRLAGQAPDARIVSEAVPPAVPAFPRPGTFMSVGGSVGLLLAGLFVWFTEARDRSVRTASALEGVTGLVTVAMVPQLVRKAERLRPHDVALDQPLGRYSEALRDMLAAVTEPFDRPEGRGTAMLVTSAVPDEGKTTTAISLARLAAAEGLKVVLIDGDLRHPSVLGRLGLPAGPGLQEILAGKATLEQALRTDSRSPLQILPGSAAARAALASQSGERLRQVVQSLTRDVDLVVVDTAPALAVADTKLLARAVDRVLLLARWGQTSDRLIGRAAGELREVGAPLTGAVLTAVDLSRQPLYGLDDRTFAYVKHARYYAA